MDIKTANESEWWHHHGATGTLNPEDLIPDPKQPRRFMHPTELEELTESVRNSGVRESITVSPLSKMPWIKLDESVKGYFVVISGHRRRRAAIAANRLEVPVIVKIYRSEVEHREDAALLNAQRSNLTPLEEGWEIQRRRSVGESLEHIASSFGKSVAWAKGRLALTELDPSIQEQLTPDTTGDTIPIVVAVDLGQVIAPDRDSFEKFLEDNNLDIDLPDSKDKQAMRFAYQRALLAVIQNNELNALQAKELIKHSRRSHGAMLRYNKKDRAPRKQLEIFGTFLKLLEKSVVVPWTSSEYANMLRNLDLTDAEKLVVRAREAQEVLEKVTSLLEVALADKRRRSSYTTPVMMTPTTSNGAPKPAKLSVSPKSSEVPLLKKEGFRPVFVSFYDDKVSRYVSTEISDPNIYVSIWNKGGFKWQGQNEERPDHLPTLEDVMNSCQ